MALTTRFYLRNSAESTPVSPSVQSGWEVTTDLVRAMARTAPSGDPMTTVSYADNVGGGLDICLRQYVSYPLVAGQTVTGGQALKCQVRCQERLSTNNLFLTTSCWIVASNGSTIRKLVGITGNDNLEMSDTQLQNRQFTANSVGGNYTTQTGDRIVIEVGGGGTPTGGGDHDFDLRLGDAAASDLPENNTATSDDNPWYELTDTLTFVGEVTGTADMVLSASGTLTDSGGATPVTGTAELVLTASGTLTNTGVSASPSVISFAVRFEKVRAQDVHFKQVRDGNPKFEQVRSQEARFSR